MSTAKKDSQPLSGKNPGSSLPEISETPCNPPEEPRQEAGNIYRFPADYTNDAIVLVKNGKTVYRNPAYEKLIGHVSAAALGGSFINPIAPEDRERVKCYYTNHLKWKGVSDQYEVDLITTNGQHLTMEVKAAMIEYQGEQLSLAVMRDITERKKIENALKQSEEMLQTILDASPVGIGLVRNRMMDWANQAMYQLLGYEKNTLIGKSVSMLYPSDKEYQRVGQAVYHEIEKTGFGQIETRIRRKNGSILNCYVQARSLDRHHPEKGQIVAVIDLTDYKRTQKALLQKEKELEHQTRHLEEVNTALNVLLAHRDNEKKELEENVLTNIEKLIMPYLEKIEKGGSRREFMTRLGIIKSNLKELVSPFARKLSAKHLALTPREIQVADLVKLGKTNKEIAGLLDVSPGAIEFHRNNIRKKFGLKNNKTNLRSYLLSLP